MTLKWQNNGYGMLNTGLNPSTAVACIDNQYPDSYKSDVMGPAGCRLG
jgi:hypothetical protein